MDYIQYMLLNALELGHTLGCFVGPIIFQKYPSKYLQSYIREALRTFRGGMTGSGCRIHDSDLMFLVVQSITECNGQIDAKDFIDRLRLLDRHGIGRTTHKVINHRLASIDPHLAAIEVWKDSGKASAPNGAVVRTSVVGSN
ncbi:uncharacterized protein LOC144349622 [Saccoglossus kowalevskii]